MGPTLDPSGSKREFIALASVSVASGLAAIAGSFLVQGRSPAFVVIAAAEQILNFVPDSVLAAGILTLGRFGRPLLVLGALLATVGLFAAGTAICIHLVRRYSRGWPVVVITVGILHATVSFLVAPESWSALVSGFAGALVVAVAGPRLVQQGTDYAPGRRAVLRSLGTAAAALGIAWLLAPRTEPLPEESVDDEGVLAMLAAARDRSLFVGGIEPLVSEEFYTVDINTSTPVVDREEWSLRITGTGAGTPFTIDYEELTNRDAEHRFITLRCVSDTVNGRLMDTALWTGIPIEELLHEADAPERCCVRLEAADGYYQAFPRAALARGFLAWRMNGRLLPRVHGHPVRALIPGHWGEINVKWLTTIDIREEPAVGYWEERGWHGTGPVETVAKLHAVDERVGSVVLGGHAYAGTRGIAGVEVSTDGGETWFEAELSESLPGPAPADGRPHVSGEAADSWRMWRYEYEATESHDVVVRAIESDGTVQPEERTDPFPSGSTGWVSRTIQPL